MLEEKQQQKRETSRLKISKYMHTYIQYIFTWAIVFFNLEWS